MTQEYKEKLKQKMNSFVHFVYDATLNFPKQEIYSSVSQFRRAALSVVLNYIEGYARRRIAVQYNFFEISYGSLKEARFLLKFSLERGYITDEEFQRGDVLADDIGAMLWKELTDISNSMNK